MKTRRARLDRIASATANAMLKKDVVLGGDIVCSEGYVIAVRILNNKTVYNKIETVDGRMVPLGAGDVMAGVLGSRNALKGYAGVVPRSLSPGDKVNVLNLGGVLGVCTSANPDLGPPFEAQVLGAVLDFPRSGPRIGFPSDIKKNAIPLSEALECGTPLVLVAGTCMNSGKTLAASAIIRGLTRKGLKVCGVKLTGVSLRRDSLSMLDSGAVAALTFNDAGVVSTREDLVLPSAYGLLNHLDSSMEPDLIVAELGDGILGEYGVKAILGDKGIRAITRALVICAPDQVAAWGAKKILEEELGLFPTVFSGPVTDNEVGTRFLEQFLGIPGMNARTMQEGLVDTVLRTIRPFIKEGSS